MRTRVLRLRLWPMAMLALAACFAPRAGPGGQARPLEGTSWQLEELNGRPAVSVPGGGVPTLTFAEERASGNGGCNLFSGPFDRRGASLQFGALVSTRRACADPAGTSQETAYLQALQSSTRYAVYGDLLVLYARDQVVARLRRGGG